MFCYLDSFHVGRLQRRKRFELKVDVRMAEIWCPILIFPSCSSLYVLQFLYLLLSLWHSFISSAEVDRRAEATADQYQNQP